MDVSEYMKSKGDKVYERLFSGGDLFLPVSHFWKAKLTEIGCHESKIKIHHMGVDIDRFRFVPRSGVENKAARILSIGRLIEKKGFEYGIRAVARILRKNRNVTYDILGDGPLYNRLSSLIAEQNVSGKINLLGWKDRDEVLELLEGSDLLIAPSVTAARGDMEGIPMVIMEAMSMGVPVISTRHSGIPELIKNGETGILVPERDVEIMCDKIELLINNPELIIKLTKKARQHIESNFNLDKQNMKLIGLYEKLISG